MRNEVFNVLPVTMVLNHEYTLRKAHFSCSCVPDSVLANATTVLRGESSTRLSTYQAQCVGLLKKYASLTPMVNVTNIAILLL